MDARKIAINVVGVAGIAMIGAGLWIIQPPAALIGVGLMLFGLSIAGAVR